MYFVLGLLSAGLVGLAAAPAVSRRAARLTRRRVESALPVTLDEVRAGRDQLRAEHALAERRLEVNLGRLESEAAAAQVEVARKREEIARLSREREERAADADSLNARIASLAAEIAIAEQKLDAAQAELVRRDEMIAGREKAYAQLRQDYDASEQLIEEQQIEIVAKNTEIRNLGDAVSAARAGEAAAVAARAGTEAALTGARERALGTAAGNAMLATAGDNARALAARRAADLAAMSGELDVEREKRQALAKEIEAVAADRAARVAELAGRAIEVERLKAEATVVVDRQKDAESRLVAAEAALAEARAEIAAMRATIDAGTMEAGDNMRKALAASETDRSTLSARIRGLEEDVAGLRMENAELRKVAASGWEAERADNQKLRERLTAIAADVIRMGQQAAASQSAGPQLLEDGNGSARRRPRTVPHVPAGELAARSEPRSLADRIRALQSTARH